MANSWPTNGQQSVTSCVARQSPDCRGSVGLVSTKCRLLVTLVHVHRETLYIFIDILELEWENNKLQVPFWKYCKTERVHCCLCRQTFYRNVRVLVCVLNRLHAIVYVNRYTEIQTNEWDISKPSMSKKLVPKWLFNNSICKFAV